MEKKRILDQSKVRAAIRSRVLGECLMRLAQSNRLDENLLRVLKENLLAQVEGNNAQFESLQGTPFDLAGLLREASEP